MTAFHVFALSHIYSLLFSSLLFSPSCSKRRPVRVKDLCPLLETLHRHQDATGFSSSNIYLYLKKRKRKEKKIPLRFFIRTKRSSWLIILLYGPLFLFPFAIFLYVLFPLLNPRVALGSWRCTHLSAINQSASRMHRCGWNRKKLNFWRTAQDISHCPQTEPRLNSKWRFGVITYI